MADPTVPNPMVPPAPPTSPMPPVPPMFSETPVPAPPAKHGLSPRSPVVAGIAGLVIGALAAGVPLALSQGSSNSFGADKGTLNAPAAVGGFTPMAQNPKNNLQGPRRRLPPEGFGSPSDAVLKRC